jgi:hypothetical protein
MAVRILALIRYLLYRMNVILLTSSWMDYANRIMLGVVSSMRPKGSIVKEEILESFRRQDSPAHWETLDVACPKVSKSVPRLRSKVMKYFVS